MKFILKIVLKNLLKIIVNLVKEYIEFRLFADVYFQKIKHF